MVDSEKDREKAIEMRMSGKGYAEIARTLNVTISRVHTWIHAGVKYPTSAKLKETERAISAARLDKAYGKIATAMGDDISNRELGSLVSSIVSLETRRAKLLGLDAEVDVEAAIEDNPAKAQEALKKLTGHVGPSAADDEKKKDK